MKIIGKIQDKQFWADDRKQWEWEMLRLEGKEVVIEIKEINDKRTLQQNAALHLIYKQISDMCMEHGIDMREIVRDEVKIQCTPENIKWLWKLLQNALFKTKSTTELKKSKQIEVVYDEFNKIMIERTNGIICLPPFPSINLLIEEENDKTRGKNPRQTLPNNNPKQIRF